MKHYILVMALVALCQMAVPRRVAAQSNPTIQQLNEQIARDEEAIRRAEQMRVKVNKNKANTQTELKLVQTKVRKRQEIIGSMQKQIEISEGEVANRNRDIAALNRRIERLKKEYGEMIYAAWKNHKTNNSMAFIFASRDFNDATRRIDYMRRYNRLREEKAAGLRALADTLAADIEGLDAELAELDKSKKAHDRELGVLRKDEQQSRSLVASLTAEEKKISAEIQKKTREKNKAQEQLQKLIEEEARRAAARQRSAAEVREMAELSGNFEQNEGRFPYPVREGVIIDHFGPHKHPTQKELTIDNKGVNIAGDKGAPVYAIFEGTVSRVVFIRGLNNCVMVNHGSYFTVYSNLAEVTVKANDVITRNQLVGRLPATDDSADHYLHFELWKGTTYLNPELWLGK